ncbi:MAG: hypothetical protein OXE99_10115 [Cellvibrionales bacterium]|nr:hypothetical protein [Cellvibrionales bacterium]
MRQSRYKRQSGQAMVEFFVASSFVLVPLLFLISYVAKVGDVKHRAYEGARYITWEKAVTNKSTYQIQNEMQRRLLFADHDKFDSREDRRRIRSSEIKLDHFHKHIANDGDYEDYLKVRRRSLVSVSNSNVKPDGTVHGLRNDILNNFIVNYDFNERGMMTSRVELSTAPTDHLNNLNIRPHASNTMYVEAWRATTDSKVRSVLDDQIVGERVFGNSVFDALAEAANLIGFEEWDDFEAGFIRPNVVPCSRVVTPWSNRERACY